MIAYLFRLRQLTTSFFFYLVFSLTFYEFAIAEDHPKVQFVEFTIEDSEEKPIEGAKIEYKVIVNFKDYTKGSGVTKSDGKLIIDVDYPQLRENYVGFEYTVLRGGYEAVKNLVILNFSRNKTEKIRLTLQNNVHEYDISVKDILGNAVEGAKLDCTFYRNEQTFKQEVTVLTDNKTLNVIIPYADKSVFGHEFSKGLFDSKVTCNASKEGYYTKNEMNSIINLSVGNKSISITLIKPIDYFDAEFLLKKETYQLRDNILTFIDFIILKSQLAHTELEVHSINLITFKEKRYLQMRFQSKDVYNSLKFNKYDVGKNLFDEVVRKVLSPLNSYILNSKLFYGFDLIITGYAKSFADEHASAKPTEYRFLIPYEVVKKYKNKDITGQQVLDLSIILMDDERIELKLQ